MVSLKFEKTSKNTFCLEQLSDIRNLDASWILRQYKINLLCSFTEIKSINAKFS